MAIAVIALEFIPLILKSKSEISAYFSGLCQFKNHINRGFIDKLCQLLRQLVISVINSLKDLHFPLKEIVNLN